MTQTKKRALSFIFVLIISIFSIGSSSLSWSETYTVQPDEVSGIDNVVDSKNPNTNYGNWSGINAGEQDNEADAGRGLIYFSLPQNITVLSARLYLYQQGESSSNTTNVQIYRITSDWSETLSNWNNQPGVEINPIGNRAFLSNEPNGEKSFYLDKNAIQEMVDGIVPNYGFEIRSELENNDLYRFYSSSSSVASYRPKFVIEYTTQGSPTPTTSPPTTNLVIPYSELGQLHIFAIIGQSNASGRGTIPQNQTTGTVYNFGNDYKWHLGTEPIDSSTNQVDSVSIDTDAGYGFAMPFALSMGENIGLVPCAKGSTTISQWQKSYGDDTLYGSCSKRIRTALQMGNLDGILFFQGESDTQNVSDAYMWSYRFEMFANSIHEDFGNVPIVFAQLGNHVDDDAFPYWSVVKSQAMSVNLPCVSMITTDDLPMNGPHFYTLGYDIIGERFSVAMQSILCQ